MWLKKISNKVSRVSLVFILMTAQIMPFFVVSSRASAAVNTNHPSYWCSNEGVKFEGSKVGVGTHAISPISITIAKPAKTEVSSVSGGSTTTITKVIVNGGNKDAVYEPPFSFNLKAPNNNGGQQSDVSHVIVCFEYKKTTIKVVKDLKPANDTGVFDLFVNDSRKVNDGGNGAASGLVEVDSRYNATVKETAGNSSTSLSDYNTYIECKNQKGEVVASASRTGSSSRSLTIDDDDIDRGDAIVCTFYNTRKMGELKVIKEIVDGGIGTKSLADFTFSVNGAEEQTFEAVDDNTGMRVLELPLGTSYTVVEPQENKDGYATTYEGCSDVSLVAGQTATCTITNTYEKGRIIVKKKVVNDNGGTATASNFEVTVDGQSKNFVNDQSDSSEGEVSFMVAPGDYTVDETEYAGYKETFGGACDVDGEVSVPARQTVICEITNDDQPGSITLVKVVKNDNGGKKEVSDFKLYVNAKEATSGVALILNAGNYKASEVQLPGYESDGWTGACDLEGNFTLALGQAAFCYIINDDQPGRIIVHKKVVNNNGGDKDAKDFRFKVNNGQWQYFNNSGVDEIEVNAGWYTVTEDEKSSYDAKYYGCYKIYVKVGETKHCYIVNDDKAPEVEVVKWTAPNWSTQDFEFKLYNNWRLYDTFTLDGNPYDDKTPQSYETSRHFKAGWVKVVEKEVAGWEQAWIKCYVKTKWGYSPVSHPFKAEIGKKYTCKVKNVQNGQVEVTKFHDINENGVWDNDEPTLEDWEMVLSGSSQECEVVEVPVESRSLFGGDEAQSWQPICDKEHTDASEVTDEQGVAVFDDVKPGHYELREKLQEGWVQSGIYCSRHGNDYDRVLSINDGYVKDYAHVYVKSGQTTHCYVGNHRMPEIEITKVNDTIACVNRGSAVTFTIKVSVPEASQSGIVRGVLGETYIPVIVTDTLAPVHTYINGSFTATSTIRGNLVGSGITSEPAYSSSGVWNLTSEDSNEIVPGEIITLTYKATVNAAAKAGTYPTDATVVGYARSGSEVSATDNDDSCVKVPAVLGTSTTKPVLEETGISQVLQIVGGISLIIAATYMLHRPVKE